MKKKLIVIVLSLMFAAFIMSGGYGLWSETITVQGDIEVLPDPAVVEATRQWLLEQKLLMEQEKAKLEEESQEAIDETTQPDTTIPSEEIDTSQPDIEESDVDQNNNDITQPEGADDTVPVEETVNGDMEDDEDEQIEDSVPVEDSHEGESGESGEDDAIEGSEEEFTDEPIKILEENN